MYPIAIVNIPISRRQYQVWPENFYRIYTIVKLHCLVLCYKVLEWDIESFNNTSSSPHIKIR